MRFDNRIKLLSSSSLDEYPAYLSRTMSITNAYGLWGTVEPRALGEELDLKKSKQALPFLFQDIYEYMVLQMASYTNPKQVWDDLKTRFLGLEQLITLASKESSHWYELEEVDFVKRRSHTVVSIVAMEIQIKVALDVVEEEVMGPKGVKMVMNVFDIKVTVNVTSVMNLVTTTMSV
ncbi:hypothetical protein Tco_0231033 [Tanacetum coccineum]